MFIKIFVDDIYKVNNTIELCRYYLNKAKTMNNEKQPNIKMALNDKIKSLKKELQELEV